MIISQENAVFKYHGIITRRAGGLVRGSHRQKEKTPNAWCPYYKSFKALFSSTYGNPARGALVLEICFAITDEPSEKALPLLSCSAARRRAGVRTHIRARIKEKKRASRLSFRFRLFDALCALARVCSIWTGTKNSRHQLRGVCYFGELICG